MSYLLDKKEKRKKIFYLALGIFLLAILFYFRAGIWNGFSFIGHVALRPVLILGNSAGAGFSNLGAYFISKNSLFAENENLKAQILASEADRANYASVVAENLSLKETLGRKDPKTPMILSAILEKPNRSPYDTLVLDAGENAGIKTGNLVFAFGSIPIGRIAEVYPSSANVFLFSNAGEKIQVVVPNKSAEGAASGDIFMELVGRGGGNFEMTIPRDFTLAKGDQVTMPGISPYIVAIAETIISDPRDPFTKALLRSPVNIQELKFVEVAQ